ncbi:MAG: transglutaminase family protein [Thermoleophilaceae bacterium]
MSASQPRFAALAQSGGVPFDRLLLALAAEFHPVDWAAALDQLDELSRPLFGASGQAARAAGQRIATTLWEEAGLRPSNDGIDALFLDRVLHRRRGHPALLAAVYVEAARRAGVSPCVLSSPQAWFAGLVDEAEVVVLDPAPTWGGARWPGHLLLRRHCPHELAYGDRRAGRGGRPGGGPLPLLGDALRRVAPGSDCTPCVR